MTFAGMVRTSLVDFPGHVAVTVFTAGCHLRCPYCHNPGLVVGPPPGRPLEAAEVLAFLERRRGLTPYLCVTGGEPTLHRGLGAFLAAAKGMGFTIKLDTSGSHPDALAALLRDGRCDYVAMDVKTSWHRYPELGGTRTDPELYRRSAGVVRALAADYEFRTTVVPGLVSHEDVLGIGQALAGARRYVLQQFVATRETLDSNWQQVQPYRAATLIAWAADVTPYFQEPVSVRNLES